MADSELSTESDRRYAIVILFIAMLAGIGLCWTLFPDDSSVVWRVVGGMLAGTMGGLIAVGNRLFE